MVVTSKAFDRRAGSEPAVRCQRYTRTYVVIEMGRLIAAKSIQRMLDEAYNTVINQIHAYGDGPLRGGQFFSTAEQTGVHILNANNHQVSCSERVVRVHELDGVWGGDFYNS